MNNRSRGAGGEATNVFVVAASDVVRAGLASLIEEDERFALAGAAAGLTELFAQEAKHTPVDVVILDDTPPANETSDALNFWLTGENDHAPALIVIGAEKSEWLKDAFRGRAVRALLRPAAGAGEILAAVEAVSAGLIVFDPQMMETPAALFSPALPEPGEESIQPPLDALTPREREVLEMLAEGLANKEIAWRLKISEHTVKFHVASIFAKLDVSTRTEAVMQGIRRGLIMM